MTADRILLWRHGRTAFNLERRFQGQLDVDLDEVGYSQAEVAAAAIALYRPTRIVSSDLQRAAHTAQALSRVTGVPVEYDARFREVNAGQWQGLDPHQIREHWAREYTAWRSGEDVPVGGAERPSEMAERFVQGFESTAAEMSGGVLVIASHGAVMRTGLCRLLGLPRDTPREVLPGFENCHWTVVAEDAVEAPAFGGPSEHRWQVLESNVGIARAGVGAEG